MALFAKLRRPAVSALAAMALLLAIAPAAHAAMGDAVAPGAAAGKADPRAVSVTIPLVQLQPDVTPLQLHFDRDSFDLSFPISQRFKPTKAGLHLEFTNSMALIDQRSQLRVRVGDVLIAQIQLHGGQPRVSADMDIPVDVLQSGYNKLTVEVAQHYAWDCEDPAAPELWTEIDHDKSHISVSGILMPLHSTLADLDQLLAPGIGGVEDLTILTGQSAPSETTLQAGAIVAQALAFHLQYRQPVLNYGVAKYRDQAPDPNARFPHLDSSGLIGHDVILMGTREELGDLLPNDVRGQINDAFLGVYNLDDDPTRMMLIISGRNPAEVAKAATALAVVNFPFDNVVASTVTNTVQMPDSVYLMPKTIVAPGTTYRFSDLGFGSQTARSANPIDLPLNFSIPADTYTPESANIEFDLDFAYGAGMDERSVINIFINNTFERAVPLDQSSGAVLHNYAVYVPERSFQAGDNVVRFEVDMLTHNLGRCQNTTRHDNMIMTMFDSSTVKFPAADHVARQPDLRLFGRTGFPYNLGPHGEALDVAVMGHDVETTLATWEMMGRIAQITGRLFDKTSVHFDARPTDRHLLMIGAVPNLDDRVMKVSKVNLITGLAGKEFLPYRNLAIDTTASGANTSGIVGFFRTVVPDQFTSPVVPTVMSTGSLGALGALLSFQSPYASRHTAIVLTASDSSTLLDRTRALIQPAVWNQLDGDITVWKGPRDLVLHMSAQDAFTIGDRSTVNFFSFYISEHPWYWVGTVIGIFFLLSILTTYLLRKRRRRLYPSAKELE